jgi:hypothetical protein
MLNYLVSQNLSGDFWSRLISVDFGNKRYLMTVHPPDSRRAEYVRYVAIRKQTYACACADETVDDSSFETASYK